jgi:hypothetical protein
LRLGFLGRRSGERRVGKEEWGEKSRERRVGKEEWGGRSGKEESG